MMNEVSAHMESGKVNEAYRRMNYELVDSFGKNIETLANKTDDLSVVFGR